jgi:putative ABC transport system permease protein
MQLRDIAWQSLKRRRGRFAFMLVALALACGTVVALIGLTAAMEREIGDELDRFGANIVITPKARAIDLAYGGVAVAGVNVDAQALTMADVARIRSIPNERNVSAVAPKLLGTALVNDSPALLIGAVFRQERRMKSWWQVSGTFPDAPGQGLAGADLARELGLQAGQRVRVGSHDVTVVGVLAATGSVDDQALFADLELVQDALGRSGAISVIEVSALCRGCPINDIVDQIAAVLPAARVAPIAQAVATRERSVQEFTRFAYAVSVVVLLVGIVVVFTTMMSAVAERTREIGVLRAIGFRQRQIATVMLMESTAVNMTGGLLGWLAGTGAAVAIGPALTSLSHPIQPSATMAVVAVLLGAVVGAFGSIYPAWRAGRLEPAVALRQF